MRARVKGRNRVGRWEPYVKRYEEGEWRALIFRDMILDDAKRIGTGLTFLDIGCGEGFDLDMTLQKSIAEIAGRYIGVDPDPNITVGPHVSETHRCSFEEAPLQAASIHMAFAVMVLEHISSPMVFWDKVYDVLCDNGVFWGFTMDARHYFCKGSILAERLRVKNLYLKMLTGNRKKDHYDNYPAFYRTNTPSQISAYTKVFRDCQFVSFSKVGAINYFVPGFFHPFTNLLDRLAIYRGMPGSVLGVRLVK